jgi:two-component system, OmpR family, response regulator RegX3
MRIAVLEDNPTESMLVTTFLHKAGHDVLNFGLTADLMRSTGRESVDLYLLDWILPDHSGQEFLTWLRCDRQDDTPAIFITGLNSEDDIVAGLAAGADDFLIKPVRPRILLSRIEAVMRRAKPRDMESALDLPPYRIDPAQSCISLRGEIIELTEKEFSLAVFMFRNLGRLLSRGHLLEAVWGRSADIPTRTVDTHVSRVRRKLKLQPGNGFKLIPTYNFGYRLEKVEAGVGQPSGAE